MWDFMFEVIESGEQFFVECDNLEEASLILEENGYAPSDLKFCGRYTPEQAEEIGLDTF